MQVLSLLLMCSFTSGPRQILGAAGDRVATHSFQEQFRHDSIPICWTRTWLCEGLDKIPKLSLSSSARINLVLCNEPTLLVAYERIYCYSMLQAPVNILNFVPLNSDLG